MPDISGTRESARGFKEYIRDLPNWNSRFDWGNDAAWEQDFKDAAALGGGTDYGWADNVDFAFFAGHGTPGVFYFNSEVDDHSMKWHDARWGDRRLKWVVLHTCQTMVDWWWRAWKSSFVGLHMMLGFHTLIEGSKPALGPRFAYWMADGLDIRTAWRTACSECFDIHYQHAVIYAEQAGTHTYNDHLPGYGYVSPDPTSPFVWVYQKGSC